MSERYQPKKTVDIVYAARDYTTGLSDVLLDLYESDGTPVFTAQTMTEIGTTGLYIHSVVLTVSKTYVALADSATVSKQDSFTLYVGGFPGDPSLVKGGAGALVQRHLKTVWTEKEKDNLLVITKRTAIQVDALTKERDRLKEIVSIQKQLLDTYGAAVSSIDSLESKSIASLEAIRDSIKVGATTKNVEEVMANITKLEADLEKMRVLQEARPEDSERQKFFDEMSAQLKYLQEQSDILIKAMPDEALDRALEENKDEKS